jgi:hypothetical protein
MFHVKQFGKCVGLCKCTIARCGKARRGELAQAKYRHRDYACAGAPFDKCRFGRRKIFNRAITMPPNGASRSYTATPRQSPNDASLFGGIRDLAHRRAVEAYDKAAIRSHQLSTIVARIGWRDELATLFREATHYKMIVG